MGPTDHGPADLDVDSLTVDLVNVDRANTDVIMTTAEPDPVLMSSMTRGAPRGCHVVDCVFFLFRKPLFNSRNCFKLQKFIINQPKLRKL